MAGTYDRPFVEWRYETEVDSPDLRENVRRMLRELSVDGGQQGHVKSGRQRQRSNRDNRSNVLNWEEFEASVTKMGLLPGSFAAG